MKLLVLVALLMVGCCCAFVALPQSTSASLRVVPSSDWTSSCARSCSQRTAAPMAAPQVAGHRQLSMYDEVGPQFAHKLVQEGYTYVDVRAENEFEHGRPAGAVNIPAFFATGQGMQVNPEFVNQVAEKFPDKESKLVLGCHMGGRSAKAAGWLEDAGYQVLVNVEGGFSAWARDESLPVEV